GLLWDPATNNGVSNIDVIRGVVPNDPASQILFARFLADQGRPVEAARVFKNVDPAARLESGQTPAFIDLLMSDGTPALARSVWANQSGVDPTGAPIVWDGGFESSPAATPSLFEWRLRETKYARISVDRQAAHNGSRSLKIEFAGIDTTRLDGEITQTIVLNPATRYRLSFYVKTDSLVSPEGPRVAVGLPGSDWHVVSSPIPTGSEGWTMMSFSFTTPAGSEASSKSGTAGAAAGATSSPAPAVVPNERERSLAAVLSIVRKPAFSYDDPTHGTIWFDDFSITEEKGQQ
ncbi:MAG TPA: carbohydrate binding domain-containing protein, partial [Blastocatellia bacterium]|nr:carbohydrate binding domain-containing protein [Blastocatellia bacterium]